MSMPQGDGSLYGIMASPGAVVVNTPSTTQSAFTLQGSPVVANVEQFAGNNTSKASETIAQHMQRNGVAAQKTVQPAADDTEVGIKKKGKTKATPVVQPITAPLPRIERSETVTFENAFGQIRSKIMAVMQHETFGYGLIFKNQDAINFVPKVGETLEVNLVDRGQSFKAYFPGVIFNWPEDERCIMLLFAAVEKEPETTEPVDPYA